MAQIKKTLNFLKNQLGDLANILLTEHSKLAIIITITLLLCLFLYVYKHPASVPAKAAPIELLPRTLGTWKGEEVFLAVPMKNNRYCSLLFTDSFAHQIRFISYQRQNEKNEQIHYPEDCLRANGYNETIESVVPMLLGDREIFFKKILATRGTQSLCHYYVVFNGLGEPETYGANRKVFGLSHFQKLVERRLQLHRNNDQLFLFTITGTGRLSEDLDSQVQSLIQAIPSSFFPRK